MHTLYGSQGSGSAAVEVALNFCGVDFREVTAASWQPSSALEELARVNPLKQIPTLVLPDGQVLTESAACLIHLGLAHPASGLLPIEPSARAQAVRGLVYIAANCYAAIGVIDYPERWTTEADKVALDHIRQGARQRLHLYWDLFADQFATRPYLNGAAPGALDLLAAVVSKWSGTRPHLRAVRPEFSALLDRVEQHPAVAPVFARHWPH